MTMPKLKSLLATFGRIALTLVVVIVALFAGRRLWTHYQRDPWTRDGRVRADVVQVAPDVSGLVSRVAVTQDQPVKRGQLLFVVDRQRFALALDQADAAVAAERAALDMANDELGRKRRLGDFVSPSAIEQSQAKADQAAAALAQAQAAREVAALNLARTEVRAPVDGYMSDLTLRSGDYVTAGKPAIGLIDRRSFRVEGYFEETKLSRLRVGEPVEVKIMGEPTPVRGHIQSIAPGIEDRDRQSGANLLPSVNPTFSWVRLAQRVPVRVALDEAPADIQLIAGRTATVAVLDQNAPASAGDMPRPLVAAATILRREALLREPSQ
jgi:multidrug resistance efflux pump